MRTPSAGLRPTISSHSRPVSIFIAHHYLPHGSALLSRDIGDALQIGASSLQVQAKNCSLIFNCIQEIPFLPGDLSLLFSLSLSRFCLFIYFTSSSEIINYRTNDDIRRTRIRRRAWMNDNRLAKIAKNGNPNIFRYPEWPPKHRCESWISTSQENRHIR